MIPQCDYLRSHTIPQAFTSERAELAHINEQITSLDSHISQLNMLRHALHRRSCQLRNLHSPVHILPIEVLSYIFQQGINRHTLAFPQYRKCLGRALVLSSVSAHFRHAALGTPELWKRIPLSLTDGEAISKVSSLLQHCIALTPDVNISVFDKLDEEEARSAIKVLLTSDTMRKVKAFELFYSTDASNLWLAKLKGSSFPMLDALSINYETMEALRLNLITLKTVTRLNVCGPCPNLSIIVPLSIQYLDITDVSQQTVVSLFYQCPNLVELSVNTDLSGGYDDSIQFNEPLTLLFLERLTLGSINAVETSSSVGNLRLPSLKSLQFEQEERSNFIGVILLCRNVSSNLTSLIINTLSETLHHDDLYQLCRLPFPKLVELEFASFDWEPFQGVIRVLAPLDVECNTHKPRYFPALKSIFLRCGNTVQPHILLLLLKEWRIGEAFYFHLKLRSVVHNDLHWSPELLEELRSIVGSRQIDVTWGRHKVHKVQKLCVEDGSLPEAAEK